MRTFISFNLEENTGNQILDVQSQIRKRQKPSSVEFIKWENKSKFHLTVFFLGDIVREKPDSLILDLENFSNNNSFGEIIFESGGIGCFPNFKFPRVIFINLKNDNMKVFEFYDKLSVILQESGFESDKKFHPHLTLARIKNNFRPNLYNINEELKFNLKFSINKFHLMESKLLPTGSVYKEIKSFGL
ncbi:MAG TPA: RNA 2',3'-cyclic phosphodiesterase [Ignavibacteria bacterium]